METEPGRRQRPCQPTLLGRRRAQLDVGDHRGHHRRRQRLLPAPTAHRLPGHRIRIKPIQDIDPLPQALPAKRLADMFGQIPPQVRIQVTTRGHHRLCVLQQPPSDATCNRMLATSHCSSPEKPSS